MPRGTKKDIIPQNKESNKISNLPDKHSIKSLPLPNIESASKIKTVETIPPLLNTNSILNKEDNVSDSYENILSEPDQFDTSNSSNDEETISEKQCLFDTFSEKLRSWALKFQINHNALNSLLILLKSSLSLLDKILPKDSRTLLETPRTVQIENIEPNKMFWYNGLERSLLSSIKENSDGLIKSEYLELIFNMDGLPIAKSSKYEFWPILALIQNTSQSHPVVVAIYYGQGKPNIKTFLTKFVDELTYLPANGIQKNGQYFKIKIKAFVCDSPARAFIKGTAYYINKVYVKRIKIKG